jgi:DNA-binding NarL/FixJ family response regulator
MSFSKARTAVVQDRQPLWLAAVDQLLRRVLVEVVAQTTLASDALAAVAEHEPDLLVTDLDTGETELDGVDYTRRARELAPNLKVVVLSARQEPDVIQSALAAGAAAYVVKTAHPDDIASAIRQAFDHSIFLPGGPSRDVVATVAPRKDIDLGLTRRETQILRLVSEGHSNGELARMLWVTEQTVKFHLSNVYRKLHVSNRTEAARWAQVNGLLEPNGDAGVA